MARDDEPAESSGDLPSFQDLVDRVQGSRGPHGAADEPDEEEELALDPSEHTVRELRRALADHEFQPAELRAIRDAEAAEKDRVTAIDAIEDAIKASERPDLELGEGLPDLAELAKLGADAAEGTAESGLSSPKASALLELIDDAANVLVIGPAESPVEYDLCATLCTAGDRPRRRVLVTTIQAPDERLSTLRGYGAGAYDETTIIAVGDRVRSAGRVDGATLGAEGEDVSVERVSDASDLTRLGLLINKSLGGADEERPVLCVHSLTAILQVVEVEKAFRFLHVLQGRVRSAATSGHYHLDPTALDEEVVNTIRPLFDFTVRFDDDGDLSVDS